MVFAFVTCLAGAAAATPFKKQEQAAEDCFGSARQKYLAEDLSSHIAVMSRLYNDIGSAARDRVEGNVNSINFPEFHKPNNDTPFAGDNDTRSKYETKLKEELLQLARYERHWVEVALENLLSDMGEIPRYDGAVSQRRTRKANAFRLYAGAAKLYGDIYTARDLSNRVEKDR